MLWWPKINVAHHYNNKFNTLALELQSSINGAEVLETCPEFALIVSQFQGLSFVRNGSENQNQQLPGVLKTGKGNLRPPTSPPSNDGVDGPDWLGLLVVLEPWPLEFFLKSP